MSAENEKLVTDFCNMLAVSSEGMAKDRFLAEDVKYLNVPLEVIEGREATLAFLDPFIGAQVNCLERIDIPTTASSGNLVFNERVEYWVKGDVKVTLPVAGVFEVRDGLIVAWRDYFDLPTLKPLLDAVLAPA